MKWPWVSRALHEVILSEREATLAFYRAELERRVAEVDRLRDENAKMVEHLRRIDRIEHGVAEVPRAPKRPIEGISRLAYEHAMSWDSKVVQDAIIARLEARHRKGESWEEIDKSLTLEQRENGTASEKG